MRRVFSVLLFLTAGFLLPTGIAVSESETLRPLPIATDGGPGMYATLNVGGSDWKIAGVRHYLDGDSTFRLQVTAKIPRS